MSSSILAWRWVIESLAAIPDVGTSILSALVDKFPDVITDSSGAVRERVALRYVEECSGMACGEIPPVVAANASSTLKIDASKTCEEVLLSKMTRSNDIAKGKTNLDGADLHHFVLLKKAALPKSSIDLLKEKILGSCHPESSHSKEINDLPDLPKVSRPCLVNNFTSNNHRDHDDIRKLIRNLKYANSWLKKFTMTRRYRRLKKLDGTPSKSIGGRVSQNISSSQKHLEEQNAFFREKSNQQTNVDVGTCNVDDGSTPLKSIGGRVSQNISSSWKHLEEQNASFMEKRGQQTNVDDGTCNVHFVTPAKISTSTFEEESAELQEVNLSGYAQAPNSDPSENFIELLAQFGEESENPQNVIRDDRCEFGQQSPKQQNILHDNTANSQEASSDCGDVPLLEQNSTHQSSHAQNSCIICHRSGSLLDCLGNGCSRSIHESCSGLRGTVVKNSRFYCPFCFYKKAQYLCTKAKRRLKKGRRNFSLYFDTCLACTPRKGCAYRNQCTHSDLHSDKNFCRGSGEIKYYETQNAETRNKSNPGVNQNQHDDVSYKIILPRKKTIECDTGQVSQVTPTRGRKSCRVTEYQHPVGLRASPERNNIDASIINSRNEVCRDHMQVVEIQNLRTGDNDQEKRNLLSRECDYNSKRKALALHIGDRFCQPSRRDGKTFKTDNYQMTVLNQQTDNVSSRELRTTTQRKQNHQSINPKGPTIRRTMLIWKPEEEQALEEAILKIPRNIDGSIPWIKILEYTRPVLHESRTPIDLKDKWRNMQKKVKKRRRV